MKLLHIYAGNLFGGIETLLVTLEKERSLCMQMQPHFALCFEGRLANELRSLNANVHLLGNVRISRPWTIWKARLHVEAHYAGLPVVTAAIGGAVEIVDDSCGRVVAPNDINALSKVLGLLISNPSERATLAAGGKLRAEYLCNPQRQITQLYNILSTLQKAKVVV